MGKANIMFYVQLARDAARPRRNGGPLSWDALSYFRSIAMVTTDQLVKELIARHKTPESLAAWCIGYIGSLERSIDGVLVAVGKQERQTGLKDNLMAAVESREI